MLELLASVWRSPLGAYAMQTEHLPEIFHSVTKRTDRIRGDGREHRRTRSFRPGHLTALRGGEPAAVGLAAGRCTEAGRGAARPAPACGSACSTAASTPATRMVGPIQGAVAVAAGDDDELAVVPDPDGDAVRPRHRVCGDHPQARARLRAHSVRVLGGELTGTGPVLLHGLRWAIEQRFDVINLSLSTTKSRFAPELRELTDRAYFGGSILVASAHNMPVESFPWRFSSVLSVGSHAGSDPLEYYVHPEPAGRVRRARGQSRARVARGSTITGDRQFVRRPAHGRDRRAGDVQARASAPVRAQDRAARGRQQRQEPA